MTSAPVIPLLIDTDIGDDIDDALALAMILNSPEFEVRGITTAFVDAPRRAQLALKLLSVWGRADIPVSPGCSEPLLQKYEPQENNQFKVLEADCPEPAQAHAVDFLVKAAETAEPFTLLGIAPLTNIALALARQPKLATAARLFSMGGQGLRGSEPEWNMMGDPEAAAMVFRSGIEIWQIGYDITSQVRLNQPHLDQLERCGTERTQLLKWLIEFRQNGRAGHFPYLHDPLVALALCTDCITFEPKSVDIELCGPERGMLRYGLPQGKNNYHVAVSVDVERAIDAFMERTLV